LPRVTRWVLRSALLFLRLFRLSIASLIICAQILLEEFYDQMQPITAVKPYMVTAGNHEANCDNGGTSDSRNNTTMNAKQTIRRQYCNMTIRRPQYSVYDISHI
jgi:hypothetical protein